MSKNFGQTVSRISTGATAFVCAGVLIYAIMSENGGSQSSQSEWDAAQSRSVAVSTSSIEAANAEVKNETSVLDQILTGGIKPIEEMDASASTEEVTTAPTQERSVLAIIRENSDIQPSVSSGTDRVSVTVKSGDTLFSIARKHGLKVTELAGMNGLQEPYVIKIGQTLYVAR